MPTVEAQPFPFTFDMDSTALLVIDMQRDFLMPGGFGESLGNDVSELRRTIAPLEALPSRVVLPPRTTEPAAATMVAWGPVATAPR